MAYSLEYDIALMASERVRLTDALLNETDPEKLVKITVALTQFDEKVKQYYKVQGSDGPGGTTMHAQGLITFVNQFLGGL